MPAKIRPAAVLATLVGLAVTVILVLAGVVALSGAEAASKVSCGDTITTDTTLHHNLVNCPNNGIIIGADNVTLDLNGHTIDGDGTPAAGLRPRHRVLRHRGRSTTATTASPSSTAPCANSPSASSPVGPPHRLLDVSAPENRSSGMLIVDSPEAWCETAPRRNGVHTPRGQWMSMFSSRRIRVLHSSFRDNGHAGIKPSVRPQPPDQGNLLAQSARRDCSWKRRRLSGRANRFPR